MWQESIEYFSRDFKVIAPEQVGHGRTPDDPSREMDSHAMAEDTAELLKRLNIENAHVLGWSDGGVVGLDPAINHPALVKKLVISGANFSPLGPILPGIFEMSADTIPDSIRGPYERLSPDGAAHWPVVFARLKRMGQTQPNFSRSQLGGITAPTLVIAGDRDFVSPECTVQMGRAIPRAQLWIAPHGDHGLPLSHPALFNATVGAFFKES